MSDLFAMGIQGGQQQQAAPEQKMTPQVAVTAPGVLVGVNMTDAKGIDNFDRKAYTDQKMVNWGSSDKPRDNFMQREMKKMAAGYQDKMAGIDPKAGSSSGGSSGGGSTATSSSGSSAPVSSGGGGGGGGGGASGGGGAPAARGGSNDASLATAVASLQGIGGLAPMEISAPVQMNHDFTPAPPAPVVAQAPSQDGPGLG